MSKNDDKIEELEDWRTKKEIEDGIRKGMINCVYRICIGTIAIVTVLSQLGAFMYHNWKPIRAAVDAFNKTVGGGE